MQARSASAQIVVKLAISKQTKSIVPYFIMMPCPEGCSLPSILAAGLPRSIESLEKCADWDGIELRLCPMLNGTMKQDEGFGSSAFTIGTSDL